jgi:Protein of unknown function (DUF2500)
VFHPNDKTETSVFLFPYVIICKVGVIRGDLMDNFEDIQEFQEPGFGAGDWIFEFGPIFIGVIFVLVIGIFLFAIVKGISQWSHNNKQPQLTVPADVKTKRSRVSGGANDTSAHTTYFVTFEVESGDRMEFQVKPQDYGLLVEGDKGHLTFQGTRYKGFERNRKTESI